MTTEDSVRTIRIGSGAGYSGDRIEPAVELAEKGDLQYLVFECLGERTVALAQQARMKNPESGYDPLLEERMRAVLPLCAAKGIKVVTNMGAANPVAAARRTAEIAKSLGLSSLKIAAVVGDDVLDACKDGDLPIMEFDGTIKQLGNRLLSANAYLGAEPIAQALTSGADIVITGRASDPALFLAPMIHAFGWAMDDWNLLGQGTVAGHLLECAGQITGGYFADPGYKDVADLARLGFPIGEVGEDGSLVITKVAGSGGAVTAQTCKEQLLYEVHDPKRYLQPDVVADFSQVKVEEIATGSRPRQRRARHQAHRYAEGLGRLCRQLYRRGSDFLCRPGRAGAGAAGAGDRAGTAETDRRCGERIAVRTGRRRLAARASGLRARPTNLTRCASASPAAPKTCARPSGSATRWKRSTPMAPPPAAARGNRRATWSRWRRCCCRVNWQNRRSSSWGRK